MAIWFVILNFLFIVGIRGWPPYRYKIPNGENVPVPTCSTTLLRMIGLKFSLNNVKYDQTVGHAHQPIPGVQSNLNRFGMDFLVYHQNWTQLCSIDSDGDGLSNGVELGDDDCSWVPGQKPKKNAISHPGFHNDCSMIFQNI